ncbi:hypothetical protein [Paenibacillus sp. PL2-23]
MQIRIVHPGENNDALAASLESAFKLKKEAVEASPLQGYRQPMQWAASQ